MSKTNAKIGTSLGHWIVRGMAAGIMLFAAVNASSYFFHSDSINNLFGRHVFQVEAVGYPFVFWQEGNAYGGLFIDYLALGKNAMIGLLFGSVFAAVAVVNRRKFESWINDFEAQQSLPRNSKLQFSLQSLLIATAMVSGVAAFTTTWIGTKTFLWFVYVLGPATMIGISFLPKHLRWQHRVVILTSISVIVIGGAIWSGLVQGMEFDKVLLGIFVFWTPQGAFAALGLMIYLFVVLSNSTRITEQT